MVQKSEIFSCQKYFEMLSSLILDGAIKVFQSKNTTLLSRKEEELHTILQNMPVMVDALDYNGDFVLWNRECEIVTGYTAEEIIEIPMHCNYCILIIIIAIKYKRNFNLWKKFQRLGNALNM